MCALLVGCGKPMTETEPDRPHSPYDPTSFTLRAMRSFDPEYNIDGNFQTREFGWYALPQVAQSRAMNNSPEWVHLEHDGDKFCYKYDGLADFIFDHTRKATLECADLKGRETRPRTKFFVTWTKPVFLRVEKNCPSPFCRPIEVEATISKLQRLAQKLAREGSMW